MNFSLILLFAYFFSVIKCENQREDSEFIYKGDILIRKDPKVRAVLPRSSTPWPGATVIYEIASDFTQSNINTVLSAMRYISAYTCVKFKRRTTEQNYVGIRNGNGCNSEVGYLARGKQSLTLQLPACMQQGVIIHELLHTLGFDHEQCRPDRDNYVNVHYDNIQSDVRFAFNKYPYNRVDLMGEQYDAKSVMHYFFNTFAIDNNKPTITSKQPGISNSDLGRASAENRMTETDIRKVRRFYRCS